MAKKRIIARPPAKMKKVSELVSEVSIRAFTEFLDSSVKKADHKKVNQAVKDIERLYETHGSLEVTVAMARLVYQFACELAYSGD